MTQPQKIRCGRDEILCWHDYEGADWPNCLQSLPELDDGDVTDSEGEELEEWAAHECENGWEPPLGVNDESDTESQSSSCRSPSPPWLLQNDPIANTDSEDLEDSRSPSPEWILREDNSAKGGRQSASTGPVPPASTPYSRLFNGPIFVQKYPDARAGAPISQRKQRSTNEHYRTNLSSSKNIFEPFAHETDWLVARWAKNRGPGSTATTELLSIPHVCLCQFCASNHTHTSIA